MRVFALGIAALSVIALTFIGIPRFDAGGATASPQPGYEYSVLPGVQRAGNLDIWVSQSWHGARWDVGGLALDFLPIAVGDPVYAVIRTDKPNSKITATVDRLNKTGDVCRFVQINFYEQGNSDDPIGRLFYTHVNPTMIRNQTVPLKTTAGGVTEPLQVGTLALPSWVLVRDDEVGRTIQRSINRAIDADDLSVDGIGTFGAVQYVWVGSKKYTVRRMFAGPETSSYAKWYEQTWRAADNQKASKNSDGKRCPSTGAHLHQGADTSRLSTLMEGDSSMWRNLVFGAGTFCPDTWIFKLYPPKPADVAIETWRPGAAALQTCTGDRQPGFGTSGVADIVASQGTTLSNVTLPAATGGNGTLTYNLWPALPQGLAFDSATRVLSGTPSELKAHTQHIWTVTDSDGDTAVLTFDLTVNAPTSPTPTATTPPTTPSPPMNLTATEGDRSIRLEWADPDDSGITSYEYCTNTTAGADCTSWRTISGATSTTTMQTITQLANGSRLTNGTTYYVQIRARNSEGASRASNEDSATPMATTPPPQPIASLTINAAAIAGDGTVNKAEKAAGFAISGSSEAGATVTVTVGTTALSAVTASSTGSWTVSVPAVASYVSDGRLTISATATRSGFSDGSASATITVDTVPPSVSYNDVPTSLTVNTEVTISPTTTDADIHRYALKTGSTLPSDLSLDDMSGVISGSPDAATTAAVNLTIVVTDNARNSLDVPLRLPAVTGGTGPPVVCRNTLRTTAGSNGRIIPSHPTGQLYDCRDRVTLTAEPDSDAYRVDSWSGDCRGSGPTCTVAMSAPRSAHVTFEAIPSPTLPVVTMGLPTSAPDSVTEGTTITFRVIRSGSTAAPLPVTWSVTQSGNFLLGTPQRAGTIGAGNRGGVFRVRTDDDGVDERDGSVTATVTGGGSTYTIGSPPSQTVTVTDNDETLTTFAGENGRIIPRPGDHVYTHGAPVTVTADPDTDFDVDSWGGDCSGSGGTCTLVMNGPRTASVTFKAEPTLPVVTMGLPTSAPDSVTEGTTITFRVIRSGSTAAPLPVTWSVTQSGNFLLGTPQRAGTIGAGNRGGVFRVRTDDDGVDERDGSVTATVTGGGSTYTIGSPPSQTVTVTDNDETLTTFAGENGRIIPRPGDHVYTHGAPVTVTADPDTDFDVDSWGGDCSGSGGTCTLVMNGPRTASVTFKAEPTLPVVTMGLPTSAPDSVTEGTTITFRVIRSGSTAAPLPVTWSVTQSGNFLSGTPQRAGTIGAGNRGGVFRVITANDGVDEPDGSVTATVTGGGSTYTIGAPSSQTVTVTDNDETPTYTVSTSLEEKNNCGGWDCGGSVSVSPSGPYTPNTEITVTASLDDLTFLDEWEMTVGGVTTTHNGETLTFDITGNTTVTGYIRSVCEVMIEVCTLSREEEGGDGEQQSPPP